MVMVNANGWRVEKVPRVASDQIPFAELRISWHGFWQADCLTTAEVAEYVDLSTLVPETPQKYASANVKAPWQSASQQLEALEKATAQSRQSAKTRSDMDDSPGHLRVVPNNSRTAARRAMNSSRAQLENPAPTF
jgi:hypothetical protein